MVALLEANTRHFDRFITHIGSQIRERQSPDLCPVLVVLVSGSETS